MNYVVASGDAQGTIPATITFTDTSGNTGSATVNILSNGVATTNGTASITSNANSSGVLYAGNSITFTLTPSTPAPSARSVTGSYNGVPLSWYTTNNGVTYTAVYTVASGQGNTSYPVQVSGVTIVDQYGNTLVSILRIGCSKDDHGHGADEPHFDLSGGCRAVHRSECHAKLWVCFDRAGERELYGRLLKPNDIDFRRLEHDHF